MRLVSSTLACVLTAGVLSSAAAHADASGSEIDRIRPMQPIGRRLITDGVQKSPTFRRLVNRIQNSDLIVYVNVAHNVSPRLGGVLTFVAQSATDRYLQITVNGQNSIPMLVALLGHELQHAVEVADNVSVNSSDGLRGLYQRIGVRTSRNAYDSRAAQLTGQTVRAELHGAEPDTRLARHTHDDVLLAGASISAQ